MNSIVVPPSVIISTVNVAADCEVQSVEPHAPPQVVQYFHPMRSVIVSVAGVEIADRSGLREILALLPADAPVEFVVRDYHAAPASTAIHGSVECDGALSSVAPPPTVVLSDEEEPPAEPPAEPFSDDDSTAKSITPRADNVSLLAFDTIDVSAGNKVAMSFRDKIANAINRVPKGRCVVAVTTAVSPIAEIENLATDFGRRIVLLNCALKLRHRPTNDALCEMLADALRNGYWFVVLHGHKSIQSLRTIEGVMRELWEHSLEGVNDLARVIICTESHPHFPRFLIRECVPLRVSQSFSQSRFMLDSMCSSVSFVRLMQGASMSDAALAVQPGAPAAAAGAAKKRVRISPSVDIVDIAPREVCEQKPRNNLKPIDVSGSVVLMHTFSGLPNDKFLSVSSAGTPGRYAVGSSLGNVYFLDDLGNGVAELHAHDGSVWDMSFTNGFNFVTGSEDGSCAFWSSASDDGIAVERTGSYSLGADIYCVHHQFRGVPSSPLVVGGLAHKLLVANNGTYNVIETGSSVQAVTSLYHSNLSVVGSGDGSLRVFDIVAGVEMQSYTDHQRKIPTLCINSENMLFTGSFDCTIRSWDARVGSHIGCTHTLKLKNYITGLDIDDNHLAASVGDNIYLWDVRKLNEVLGGYPQGWKGLSRGIKIDATHRQIVTASPDGLVRFWQYH